MDAIDVPDFGEIDEIIEGINSQGMNFSDYVTMIRENGGNISFKDIFDSALHSLGKEFTDMRKFLVEIICIVVVAALFVNISKIYKNKQASETGFYITYMFLFMMLAVSFGHLHTLVSETMEKLLAFMQALVPAFFMTVSYVSGSIVTATYYQEALILIALVEALLVKIFLPFINVYFVFSMVNPILGEDLFSNMLELMEKLVIWSLKTVFAIVLGVGAIQGIILPVNSNIKMVGKMGGTISAVIETVMGAGIVIKNAIGTAGLIAIVAICIYPVAKLAVYALLYQLGAAIAQPVSGDKRMSVCMKSAFNAARLLLMVLIMSTGLFMVTIAVVTISAR